MDPNNPQPKTSSGKAIVSAFFVSIALVGAVFFIASKNHEPGIAPAPVAVGAPEPSAFDSVAVEAHGVYVWDVREQKALYAKNSDIAFPLASLTKVLLALVVVSDIPEDAVVTISPTALQTEGESGLFAGERWNVTNLASFMLVTSSNDAATALKEIYEEKTGGSMTAALNNRAERLGLTRSRFVNETGLDIGEEGGNVGSARDMAVLFEKAMSQIPAVFDKTRYESSSFTSLSGNVHTVKSTNMLINDIPWAMGGKTGFTDSAGGNLAVSLDVSIGHPVIIVVLGSSREGRFRDMNTLIGALFASK